MKARLLITGALLLALCAVGCFRVSAPSAGETPVLRIAAASDLAVVMPELTALHEQTHGVRFTTTLGSSGLLSRQIAQGAPFDLFFSANAAFVDDLVSQGHALAGTRALYARGRIVLWSRSGSVRLDELREPRFGRIAIANPEHAPYGLAAKQALTAAGLWEDLLPRLVYGENILDTLRLCQSGNAEVALVALSLALPSSGGEWTLLSDSLHDPMDQALVVTAQSHQPEVATAFAATVNSPAGREILRSHGFVLPGEELDPAILASARGRIAR